MSLVPAITRPCMGAFVGGLFYGSVSCTASCLTYVASHTAGTDASILTPLGASALITAMITICQLGR